MKYKRNDLNASEETIPCKYRENLFEEIADVEIMTAQLKHIFNCGDEVEVIKCAKLQRQMERIKNE